MTETPRMDAHARGQRDMKHRAALAVLTLKAKATPAERNVQRDAIAAILDLPMAPDPLANSEGTEHD